MAGETKIVNRFDAAGALGPVWVIGWFFTVGFLHFIPAHVFKALLCALFWPYYLGRALGN